LRLLVLFLQLLLLPNLEPTTTIVMQITTRNATALGVLQAAMFRRRWDRTEARKALSRDPRVRPSNGAGRRNFGFKSERSLRNTKI